MVCLDVKYIVGNYTYLRSLPREPQNESYRTAKEIFIRVDTFLVLRLWENGQAILKMDADSAKEPYDLGKDIVCPFVASSGYTWDTESDREYDADGEDNNYLPSSVEVWDTASDTDYDADEENNFNFSPLVSHARVADVVDKRARNRAKKALKAEKRREKGKAKAKKPLMKTHKKVTLEDMDLDDLCKTWLPDWLKRRTEYAQKFGVGLPVPSSSS